MLSNDQRHSRKHARIVRKMAESFKISLIRREPFGDPDGKRTRKAEITTVYFTSGYAQLYQ